MSAHIDWLSADAKNLSYTTTNWNRPSLIRISFPVGSYNGDRCQVPAIRQVIVDNWLPREEANIFAPARVPDIAEQRTHNPVSGHGQNYR
jgi:hypothetical protein